MQRKLAEKEQATLAAADLNFHQEQYERLRAQLQSAFETSTLPEAPSAQPALDALLVRLRLADRKNL